MPHCPGYPSNVGYPIHWFSASPMHHAQSTHNAWVGLLCAEGRPNPYPLIQKPHPILLSLRFVTSLSCNLPKGVNGKLKTQICRSNSCVYSRFGKPCPLQLFFFGTLTAVHVKITLSVRNTAGWNCGVELRGGIRPCSPWE